MPGTSVRVQKLEACHAATCLSDYWGGHHRPHLQVAVHREMTLKGLKEELINALHEGCLMGSDVGDDCWSAGPDGTEWYRQAGMAVNNITPLNPHPEEPGLTLMFPDLEPEEDEDSTVYAFFVFMEAA